MGELQQQRCPSCQRKLEVYPVILSEIRKHAECPFCGATFFYDVRISGTKSLGNQANEYRRLKYMVKLEIDLDGEGKWPDAVGAPLGLIEAIAALPNGTTGNRPSVAIKIRLRDGSVIMAETTARIWCTAADALRGRYPEIDDA